MWFKSHTCMADKCHINVKYVGIWWFILQIIDTTLPPIYQWKLRKYLFELFLYTLIKNMQKEMENTHDDDKL